MENLINKLQMMSLLKKVMKIKKLFIIFEGNYKAEVDELLTDIRINEITD